jgi:hypothetical protein
VNVSFSNTVVSPAQAGPVNLNSIGTGGSLAVSAGTLNVGNGGMALETLGQTGGAITSTGAVAVANLNQSAGTLSAGGLSTTTSFNQSGSGTIDSTGNVLIGASVGPVSMGNLTTAGNLSVSSSGGAITQSAGTSLNVAGFSDYTASNSGAPADVILDSQGNNLVGSVTASGRKVRLSSAGKLIGGDDSESPPPVLAPRLAQADPAYRVTLLTLPQNEVSGVVHIEWRDTLVDTQIMLPAVLQDWIRSAGSSLKLGAEGEAVADGLVLSSDGGSLNILPSAELRFPANVILKSNQGTVIIRIVNAR